MSVPSRKHHVKLALIILSLFVGVAGFVLYFGVVRPYQQLHSAHAVTIDGVVLDSPQSVTDFHLTDHNGNSFSKKNLKGQWTLLFFGFTNCGMVCPTTLAALNNMYHILQRELPDNELPQVVMISVDPERDSVERMKEYIAAFNPHFIGARGETAEINALEKQLHIVAVKMQAEGQSQNQYTINHSAEIMLFNPEGMLQAFLSYPHKAEQMAKDYKAVLQLM